MSALHGAFARHGGDLWLACQHVLVRLYPDDARVELHEGPRPALIPEETPSFTIVASAVVCRFSSYLLVGTDPAWCRPSCPQEHAPEDAAVVPGCDVPHKQHRHEGHSPAFSRVLRGVGDLCQPSEALRRTGDRVMVCMRDVLQQFLGPAAAAPKDLPEPVSPLSTSGEEEVGPGKGAAAELDVRVLAKIVRTVLQAHNTDPALLAAREDASHADVDVLSAGSFAGPTEPGDFVPVPDDSHGPLRRSLAFMEQSALLQVVQSKLCAANFSDVEGSTENLAFFALRNMRVLWFDLRRCTSTLKRDLAATVAASTQMQQKRPSNSSSGSSCCALLALRNLRLGMVHDWEAKLGTFPYLHLHGGSR